MANPAPTITPTQIPFEAPASPATIAPPSLQERLSQDAIFERLQLAPPALVKEINDLVVRQIAHEAARQQRLDSKANALLGAVGLVLTVASTFGVQLLTTLSGQATAHPWAATALATSAFVATLLGLGAAACAIYALNVRSYVGVGEEAIFSTEAIQAAKAAGESKDEQEIGVAIYRRMMVEHLWPVVQQQEAHHASKAQWVRRAQRLFWWFLACLPVTGAITVALR